MHATSLAGLVSNHRRSNIIIFLNMFHAFFYCRFILFHIGTTVARDMDRPNALELLNNVSTDKKL